MISPRNKQIAIEVICFLYALLFVYAATNKFLDFENFQVQLAQSPLLSSFAGWVSWFVPLVEILIAGLFYVPKSRLLALYFAFGLMVMFSVYIVIILNFSPFVPCSCGGILEKLSWSQHLLFNLVYCILAIPGIVFESQIKANSTASHWHFKTLGVGVLSAAVMTILFIASEDMFHRRNNFTRRFPHHPAEFLKDHHLHSGSSYLAGASNGRIYIGDINNPLQVIEIDSGFQKEKKHIIMTDEPNRKFRNLRVVVKPPHFYLNDGTEAFAFRGLVADWKASIWIDRLAYYNSFVPIDSIQAAIRALSTDANENMIGVMKHGFPNNVIFNKKLLDKQIDGVFDTDGKLLFNQKHRKLLYVYAYRNEYLVTDPDLKLKIVGNTIDTTSQARIEVAYLDKHNVSKLASPARIVNKTAVTDGDFLYVNSKLIGQFEQEEMWDEASIIDVYNFITRSYQFSFYLYDKGKDKVSEFIVDNGKVYTLAGNTLSVYHLDAMSFEKNK